MIDQMPHACDKIMEPPQPKRPRRAAADAASAALVGATAKVAELCGVHPTQRIALTSADVLEQKEEDFLRGDSELTVVTLHDNARPSGLPKAVRHVGAAFDDSADFDDHSLTDHLKKMAAYVWAADTRRVLFVCQAGVNRSSLALCVYVARHGNCSWQQAKAALVAAKGGAARGWPTLENAAFEAYLRRTFGDMHDGAASSCQPREESSGIGEAAPKPTPKWFWRTVATARSSTDCESWEAKLRNHGIDPKRGRTWGCWEKGRKGGVWVRGVPGQQRPWEGRGDSALGENE